MAVGAVMELADGREKEYVLIFLPQLAVMSHSKFQFGVVDESTEKSARVSVSRNGHALKGSFSLTSILW